MKWECYHHVQTVEAMLCGLYDNIAWDATTLNGAHINEVHVNTASGSLALNVGKLSGRTTKDYIDHIKRRRASWIVLIMRLSMTRQ